MTGIKRYTWIDCMKGIGIILVVLGHIYKDNFMGQWIYSFHMPLFLVLSGFLMCKKDINWRYGGVKVIYLEKQKLCCGHLFFLGFSLLYIGIW